MEAEIVDAAILNRISAFSTRRKNAIDREVDAIVRRRCTGITINILDIGKVFAAAYVAAASGADIETAVVAKYRELSERCAR